MNQINLVGPRVLDEGTTVSSSKDDYAAALSYAYKKKVAQKKKVQRVTVDVNDHESTEDGVVYRSSSTLADESLEITPVQP